jgi:hypothetical protein
VSYFDLEQRGFLADFRLAQTLTCGEGDIYTESSGFAGCYGTSYLASYTTLYYGCSDVSTSTSASGPIEIWYRRT